MNRTRLVAVKPQKSAGGWLRPAVVAAYEDGSRSVEIRLVAADERAQTATARLAVAAPYQPREGDRVLVSGDGDELYLIGVLHASAPPSLPIPGGGSVNVADGAVELRDVEGKLFARYRDGAVEIAAPSGDLTLAAPEGRVVIRSAKDIDLSAARDLVQRAGRRVEVGAGSSSVGPQIRVEAEGTSVESPRLEIATKTANVIAGEASIAAKRIDTTAGVITQRATRYELTATRLIERTRDALREAAELSETHAGRARTVVKEAYSLHAERTKVTSTEETSIGGRKILLG